MFCLQLMSAAPEWPKTAGLKDVFSFEAEITHAAWPSGGEMSLLIRTKYFGSL